MLVKLYVSRPEILSNAQLDEIALLENHIIYTFGGFTKYEGATGHWFDRETHQQYTDVVDI